MISNMNNSKLLFMALIMLPLLSSCEEEDAVESLSDKGIDVTATFPDFKGVGTRASEATQGNFAKFWMTAFVYGHNNYYMDSKEYNKNANGTWSTDGKFFWPSKDVLNFYAYNVNDLANNGQWVISHDEQKLQNFEPASSAASQQDIMVAVKRDGYSSNGYPDKLTLDFKHILSEISIQAKNGNSAYSVEVSGVRLGNIVSKGDFTFPSVNGTTAAWSLGTDKATYTTEWNTATKLSVDVSSLNSSNVPFMLIPQQLSTNSKAISGNYLAAKVKIKFKSGYVAHDGWAYTALGTNWQMGYHYTYNLDFTNGAGQDVNGNPIELIDKMGSNSYILQNGKMCTIYPYYRANTFWSNSSVGDAANVIGDNTEWTAEVIWQDIPSRAINFCDASGNTVSGDTYNGTGKSPLYIKAATATKGNVIVGIKKKGAGSDAYLWSWHLWLTDEPQLVSGFMDRNLGATSATPSDGSKTYGLHYQFGRKDGFVPDVDIYDINGNKLQKGATVATGKVTFAKAVNNPGTFYTYGSSSTYDWASPNNYTSKNWNDITNADGKTFFDPCPEGWRLPDMSELSNFSTTTFTWDATNKGRTYNSNWFPAAGCRYSNAGGVYDVGNYGIYWSMSPYNESYGYYLYFYSSYVSPAYVSNNRAAGRSVRCVQE